MGHFIQMKFNIHASLLLEKSCIIIMNCFVKKNVLTMEYVTAKKADYNAFGSLNSNCYKCNVEMFSAPQNQQLFLL